MYIEREREREIASGRARAGATPASPLSTKVRTSCSAARMLVSISLAVSATSQIGSRVASSLGPGGAFLGVRRCFSCTFFSRTASALYRTVYRPPSLPTTCARYHLRLPFHLTSTQSMTS